ncbi:MAG: hypothetical protein RMJ87_08540 [Cytophagales bacterium]|nr:hypothetical protein [Cytophagales bacterium]
MNADNLNPMFSFAPKTPNKEKKESTPELPEFELPVFQPQTQTEPITMQPLSMPSSKVNDLNGSLSMPSQNIILNKLNELEVLILQQKQTPSYQENQQQEAWLQQLRAHTLQIAKLTKEVALLQHQDAVAELKTEIDTLSAQLRSTNLYLSKIDRKLDYLMNVIGSPQENNSSSETQQELLQSLRTQALMLSKLERKINELSYYQTK